MGFTGYKKVFWVCSVRSHSGGEGRHSSGRHNPQNGTLAGQDHYALLGISSDASPLDIKLAFRQLARKYHPDVNNDSGAVDAFKTIRQAYETLSDNTTRNVYDHSLRAQAHAARKRGHKNHQNRSGVERTEGYKQSRSPYGNAVDYEVSYDPTESFRREGHAEYFYGGKGFAFEEVTESCDERKGPSLREGWADSLMNVVTIFCLVGFIWHTLGAQLALTYFVFFIPHNTEHSRWYRFASLMAWLVGGTKGLALHYGIVTTGWLYGKSHDMILALALLVFWMEAHFPHIFAVPRGAILLMAHTCLGMCFPIDL
ncbi:hypothetical protein GOP47_0011357 [Adiantum capillus-veneris]|uniref:J domain-containing protein n=1 Tax=Adiantum capillus-veneris TaxID=13818 RepID=A0A9D4ZFB5_ADICA|nr:hypothetical protein GOP47_0011357 [Adiantum capillus-veneris]